jgi:dolichyl-phosphate-mannose-protein mannosyltransferase/tetratricopeptide repeat protein
VRRWTPAIVFATALAVRCVIALQLDAGTALFRTPQLDSIEYFSWAQRIAAGDFNWPAAPPHGSGYPLFLGLLLFVCRGSLLGVHLLQAVMGSITAVMIAAIATRIGGNTAGLLAGLFAALYGPLALVDVSILAEGFLVFLLTASLLAMLSEPSRISMFFAGTALGVAIIVRPTAAILIPIYVYFVWRRAPRSLLLIFAIATAYPVIPVLAQNWATSGDLLAIQSGGGMNFYIGNSPRHDGTAWARPGGTWDWLRGEAWRAGVRGAAAEDHYYVRRAFAEIREAPSRYVWLLIRKLGMLTQAEEIRDSHSEYFFVERSPILRFMLPFSIVLPFAVFGLWTRRRSMPWILVAYAVAMCFTVALLVVGMRYRLPILPAVFVFAGLGAASVIESHRFTQFLVIFVIVFAATYVFRPPRNLAEEWAMEGIALGKENRIADAEAAFHRAAQLDPRMGIIWTGRGDLDLSRGRLDAAQNEYQRSIVVDPHLERAYSHLGLTMAAKGLRIAAISCLRQAVALRYDREAMYNLAGFLFAERQFEGAEGLLREIVRADPSDAEAWTGLARIAAGRGMRH